MDLNSTLKLLSPLDVLVFTIETQSIVKTDAVDDCIPAKFLIPKAESLIMTGEFPTRNITYWRSTEGKTKEEVDDWEFRLISALSNSNLQVNVLDLDNTSKVVEASCEVYMLAVNCGALSASQLKEVKCARAHTAFGPIDLAI